MGSLLDSPVKVQGNAVQRRLKSRLAIEKHTPATTPLTTALISCLDTATLPEPLEDSTGTLTPTGPMTDSIDLVRPSSSPRDTLEEANKTVGLSDVSSEHTGGTTPSAVSWGAQVAADEDPGASSTSPLCLSEAIATSLVGTGTSALREPAGEGPLDTALTSSSDERKSPLIDSENNPTTNIAARAAAHAIPISNSAIASTSPDAHPPRHNTRGESNMTQAISALKYQ